MSKKTLKELKAKLYVLATEINQVVENDSLGNEAKEELEDAVKNLFCYGSFEICDEQKNKEQENGENSSDVSKKELKAQKTYKEILEAEELKDVCLSVASSLELVSQKYDLEDSTVEKLEDHASDLNILARQFGDVVRSKEEAKKTASLDDFMDTKSSTKSVRITTLDDFQ